ncbi:MAG: ABC transporter ATP-binding protein [Thermodesulfobacteriota bacterium]
MEILKVEGLSKSFGGVVVLKSLSFSVQPGERLAVIGPNGAGKTTLFNILGGQVPASGGVVTLLGHTVTHLPPFRRLRLGLSRSYQINNLFEKLPLLDNVFLALQGAQLSHFRMFDRIRSGGHLIDEARNLLNSVGLWEMRFSPVSSMSYGDQRLVEVAFGLASKPKLLMLDEPTAGLSTAEASAFGNTLRGLLGDRALLFTAHDMDLVFHLADRILVLYSGGIIAEGSPDEIQANPTVKEIYLGSDTVKDDSGSR